MQPMDYEVGASSRAMFSSTGGNIQILVALLLENDSYETIELQRTLIEINWNRSIIHRQSRHRSS